MLGPKTQLAALSLQLKELEGDVLGANILLIRIGVESALDICGIFEPTPFCDAGAAGMALSRKDIGGAALSLTGIIPYVGDLAKISKGAKITKLVVKLNTKLAVLSAKIGSTNKKKKLVSELIDNSKKSKVAKKKQGKKLYNKKKKKNNSNCPDGILKGLNAAVDAMCKSNMKKNCNGINNVKEIKVMIIIRESCLGMRKKRERKCFSGGDHGHKKQIEQDVKGIRNCKNRLTKLSQPH